jgi:sigma-E factor negative regulatory protein RseB
MRTLMIVGLALGLVSTAYASASGHVQESPEALLQSMDRAVKQLNYEGIFVYQNGNALSTLKVVHAWDAGRVRERLVSKDGSRREVLIDGNSVTYVRPAVKSIVIMQRSVRPGLPGGLDSGSWKSAYYRPQLGRSHRVAGMSCRQVVLKPVDKLRYARRICVGLRHHLPLETEVIDQHGNVVERMLFTSLTVVRSLPASEFAPPVLGSGYTLKRVQDSGPTHASAWRFSSLPAGFKLFAERERNLAANGQRVRQLVLSDGVSTVSVFIAPATADAAANGSFLRSGALNVYASKVDGHDVTVMGEVPKRTIRDIAGALARQSNG